MQDGRAQRVWRGWSALFFGGAMAAALMLGAGSAGAGEQSNWGPVAVVAADNGAGAVKNVAVSSAGQVVEPAAAGSGSRAGVSEGETWPGGGGSASAEETAYTLPPMGGSGPVPPVEADLPATPSPAPAGVTAASPAAAADPPSPVPSAAPISAPTAGTTGPATETSAMAVVAAPLVPLPPPATPLPTAAETPPSLAPTSTSLPVPAPATAQPMADALTAAPAGPTAVPATALPAPFISSPAAQRAVTWAVAELHSPDPSWSDELRAPWSGYCEAFVEIAYGTRFHYGSAAADYLAQLAAGRIHADTNPPPGALVFYGGGSYGHVALAVGGGQIITTWGFMGERAAIRQTSLRSLTNPYYGWAYAPTDWPGR